MKFLFFVCMIPIYVIISVFYVIVLLCKFLMFISIVIGVYTIGMIMMTYIYTVRKITKCKEDIFNNKIKNIYFTISEWIDDRKNNFIGW